MSPATRRRLARLLLLAWAPLALVLSAYLFGGHFLVLPRPMPVDARLVAAVAKARGDSARGRFSLVHVLYGECRCSARVMDHLMARGPDPSAREHVVLVGADDAAARRLRGAGFTVEAIPVGELEARWGVRGAPLLVIADVAGAVRYVGGYAARKQAARLEDRAILRDLRQGRAVPPLPVFGCAVSPALRREVDPLGIR